MAVFIHLEMEQQEMALRKVSSVMKPGAVLVVSHAPPLSISGSERRSTKHRATPLPGVESINHKRLQDHFGLEYVRRVPMSPFFEVGGRGGVPSFVFRKTASVQGAREFEQETQTVAEVDEA
eukprot:CAMPEP_0114226398 /NCGR_PEP_ID=MMETSP0058-20121206/1215_1 /TAXON_ID=36894 /ORGANISM="Pyramimonas parkeae, CCMP726" /LENGTH=121 /DNA_ID=CAMNT_0001337129 /DNA_START=53 /DNA_END=418 /DNA_ORIENTATION=+